MKKLILSVTAMAACSVGVYVQGTIAFDASNNTSTSPSAPSNGEVFLNGVLDTATDINAELLYSSTGVAGTFSPAVTLLLSSSHTSPSSAVGSVFSATGDITSLSSAGSCAFFDNTGSSIILPIAAGATAYFQVEGWLGNTTYANATTAGITGVFTESLGGVGTPPSAAATINNMPALNLVTTTVVPEPSTLAMTGVGLASMLFFRRRNK